MNDKMPCRTATQGNFPLDGTYFQNNEVFASSSLPVTISRESIWNLQRCTVYMGSTIHSIAQGLTRQEIQDCFRRGYICVRGLDRIVGEPTGLCKALHATKDKKNKKKEGGHESDDFEVDQWVWVRLDHDPAPSCKKLPPSFYGPYPVAENNLKAMGIYRLRLPRCPLLDTDFHVSQLKLYDGDRPTKLPLLSPQQVLASKLVRGVRKLLVQWPGCPYTKATLEDLKEFKKKYPEFKIQDELLAGEGIDVMYGIVYERRPRPAVGKYGLVYRRRPIVRNSIVRF